VVASIGQDVRLALRTFLRRPVSTAAILLTMALVIGANTAIFSVTNAVLFRPLPFSDASRLVMVWEDASALGFPKNYPAPASYADWKATIRAFRGVSALYLDSSNFTGQGDPEMIGGASATSDLFEVLGVQPVVGRTWNSDEVSNGSHVAVIGYGFWLRRFGGDATIVGRTVNLNDVPYTIVGVLPRGFELIDPALEVWTPLILNAAQLNDRASHSYNVIARLRQGLSIEQANTELTALARRLQVEYPKTNDRLGMYAVSLLDDYVGDRRTALVLLSVAVGCVLLLACANVANLLFTQASSRAQEFSVRAALGATRGRLVRQLLIESGLLSLGGGCLGLVIAWPSLRLVSGLVPQALAASHHVTLDVRVLGVTALMAMASGLLFGLAPSWRASQVDLTTANTGTRGVVAGSSRVRNILIVGEVATAAALLIGAGLLIESLQEVRRVPLGFRPDHVLTLRLELPR
jgi:predicted permease